MNEFNTYEFVVDEKSEGKRLAIKVLGRGAMLAVIVSFVFLCFIFHVPALAVLPLALLGIVLYVWKMFNVELEYSMTSGNITFTRIYGGKSMKKALDLSIKDMLEIAPVTEETAARLHAQGIKKLYMFASSSEANDMYCAVFEKDGGKCAVYFEATAKALHILHFYNHATVVTTVSR